MSGSRRETLTPRGRKAAAAFALLLLLAPSCDDPLPDAPETVRTVCCSGSARPIFLKSKEDDDLDDDIADHAWIKDRDGVYHLFFHSEYRGLPNRIEHYTSSDLMSLDYAGVAFQNNPSGWDSSGLWAPFIVESGNTYFMFYTGATGVGNDPFAKQRIGVATSTDLTTWTRYPVNNCPGTTGDGCIYDCDECWTMAGRPSGEWNQQCRDPFVIWDSNNQRWVMFATAKSPNKYGVVTVAYSTNLTEWTGAGYINATRRLEDGTGAQTTGGMAENPFVISRRGTYSLLFCDWQDPEGYPTEENPRTMVQYATSPTLTADSSGSIHWIYRGSIPDPGVNAIEVLSVGNKHIMSQSISNDRSGDLDHYRELRLKCVTWIDDWRFDTSNVDLICGIRRRASNPMAVGFAPGRSARN